MLTAVFSCISFYKGNGMDKNNKIDFFGQILSYLSGYTTDEIENGLIAYLLSKLGYSCNKEVFTLLKDKAQKAVGDVEAVFYDHDFPVDIEVLIEFFEYLIEQDEKTENGIVFTPRYISDYISTDLFGKMTKWEKDIKIIDPGCGCGIFLISAIEEIHSRFGVDIVEIIENNIFGIDIMEGNIRRCRYILQIYCLMNGICLRELKDNLVNADSLSADWRTLFSIDEDFEYIIGNPPYVNTHDMNKFTAAFLKESFATTKTGVFNIFYAFIEHGLNQLTPTGLLEFIVPNNFLTIKAAESLRALLQKGKNISSILNFADNMVFKPVRTYNCIIRLSKAPQDRLYYSVMEKTEDIDQNLEKLSFEPLQTEALDKKGWILVNEKIRKNIKRIESQKYPIKDYIRTGIATLRDGIYFVDSSDGDYYKMVDGVRYPIESEIVKPIYKIPELKNCTNVKDVMKHIIFPYVRGKNGYQPVEENVFMEKYPNAYAYLRKMKPCLDERDKGRGNPGAWYAYGRTQGLNKYGKKLMFPTFSNHPNFIYIEEEDTLFCNGYAVFENEQIPLDALVKILNSSVMDYYVFNTSYSIEGGYYCYQKKYIEKFSIPQLSPKELEWIASSPQPDVDRILQDKYQLIL